MPLPGSHPQARAIAQLISLDVDRGLVTVTVTRSETERDVTRYPFRVVGAEGDRLTLHVWIRHTIDEGSIDVLTSDTIVLTSAGSLVSIVYRRVGRADSRPPP